MANQTTEQAGALRERFTRFLRERRLPVTRQRLQVAEAVFADPGHPSVDRLWRSFRQRGEPVGMATIYRTLALLIESGIVREHDFGEGFRRFEAVPERSHHEHLICTRCGRVVEFTHERLERMVEMIADAHEFVHQHHRVDLFGLCAECRGRDAAALRASVSGS